MSAVGDQTRHRAERNGHATILRPKGTLVWMHFETADQIQISAELVRNLRENYGPFFVLATSDEGLPRQDLRDYVPHGMSHQYAPEDTLESSKNFLDFWQPNLCVWASNLLSPNLLSTAAKQGIPLLYVNAEPEEISRLKRLLPNRTSSLLRRFSHIYVTSPEAQQRALNAGVSEDRITVAGVLKAGGVAPRCDESERSQFSAQLSGRPTWFACNLGVDDVDAVIAAQKHTARRAQRLLLIVGGGNDVSNRELANRFKAEGFKVDQQTFTRYPRPEAQVFLANKKEDDGTWFRVAPVCFLGNGAKNRRDPMAAAALGSSIIAQADQGVFSGAYTRLEAAGAMMKLGKPEELALALTDLIAPDRAAELAQAAWGVQSEGAMATDKISADILTLLDAQDEAL